MTHRTEPHLKNDGRQKLVRTRAVSLVVAATILAAAAAHAEDRTQLPPISVLAPPPPSANAPGAPAAAGPASGGTKRERCVDVTAGGEKSFGCINGQLKRKVDETNPVLNIPPIDAKSSDLKTGVVNIPGVQQQYGKNFGNSVVPYRPPPPIYNSPIGGRH